MKSETETLKRQLTRRPKPEPAPRHFLSTGATVLNLACTGKRGGGFPAGSYVLIVGDSASGKTFLAMTCFAEAMLSKYFRNHRIIYDGPEDGAWMDIERFFGKQVAEKIERQESDTAEQFYDNTEDDLSAGRPFIKVLDSIDSLDTEPENEKLQEQKEARRRGRKAAGSWGDAGKAKINSSRLRKLIKKLRKNGSILIIISQTRDNLGFGFEKKTRSGGRALRFYAHVEIWSEIARTIKRTVRGKPRKIGIQCKITVKKNRVDGNEPSVLIPIYRSTGFDDIGSCVDFLVDEAHWKSPNGKIHAPEFGFKGPAEKLIQKIEAGGRENELRRLVETVWREIEAGCAVKRKGRYS